MAKQKENAINLVDTFQEFKELKNIDRTTMINVLEESFRNVIAKMFGSDKNYDVIVNPDKGDFEIRRNRVVVEDGELTDPNAEISLSEALLIDRSHSVFVHFWATTVHYHHHQEEESLFSKFDTPRP